MIVSPMHHLLCVLIVASPERSSSGKIALVKYCEHSIAVFGEEEGNDDICVFDDYQIFWDNDLCV